MHSTLTVRKYLLSALIAACMLTASIIVSNSASAQTAMDKARPQGITQNDWNMFSFHHSRFDPYEHTLSPANVSKLVPDWSVTPTGNANCSAAAVSNGIVYIAPEDLNNTAVFALSAKTGKTLWHASPSNLALGCSSPAVVNGAVYVSAGAVDAFNAQTGAALWTNTTFNASTSPVVANGLVYVGGKDNTLYALDAKTGAVRWSALLGGSINTISATVANGVVYIGAYDNNLYAFNATTGAKLWVAATTGFVYSTPAVDGGRVYIIAGGTDLEAFNAQTGAHLWTSSSAAECPSASPAAANGVVYACAGEQVFSRLKTYSETTGKVLWQSAVMDIADAPAIANGVVYSTLFSTAGLVAFDIKTGKQLWVYVSSGQGQGDSSPTIDHGMLYFGTSYGSIDVFHLP